MALLVTFLTFPLIGRADHDPEHSGQCFAPETSADAPLANWTIVVDPGHGGVDPGAVNGDVQEAPLVLDISNLLREKLQASGARVCQTRTEDEAMSLGDRAEFANRNGGHLLVSIHLNSFDEPDVNYTMTMWQSGSGRQLAESVLEPMAEGLTQTPEGDETTIDGSRTTQFTSELLWEADMPAIFVESAFLSNPEEAELLSENNWRLEQIADAIHQGVITYVLEDRPFFDREIIPLIGETLQGIDRLRERVTESPVFAAQRTTASTWLDALD